ncbi:MAG: hypothetical protein M1833_000415 [Piccolia ochrophora]|nr:MAG: hypothetical protein M1833_000415 [Piccolia ochrophora]
MPRPPDRPRHYFHLLLLCLLNLLHFSHAYAPISDATLRRLNSPGTDLNPQDGAILSPILIPRVPGTPGSTKVLNHLAAFFRTQLPHWTLSFQNSTSKTPATGNDEVPFINLIATRDPPWAAAGEVGRLALVAHWDSKRTPHGFIGATDSAAPVAMILHAVRGVDEALTRKWDAMASERNSNDDLLDDETHGVQVLLLDGEEAAVTWTDQDSLYGARSLAETWDATLHPTLSTYKTPLASISLFMLLDLLGASSPRIPSYYSTTHWAYTHLSTLETRLRALTLFKSSPPSSSLSTRPRDASSTPAPHWLSATSSSPNLRIADDHLPFLARGVDVLHLIPAPFPRVWHHLDDDAAHLDDATVVDWALLVGAFLAEWFELEGWFPREEVGDEGEDKDKDGRTEDGRGGRRRRWEGDVRSKTEL